MSEAPNLDAVRQALDAAQPVTPALPEHLRTLDVARLVLKLTDHRARLIPTKDPQNYMLVFMGSQAGKEYVPSPIAGPMQDAGLIAPTGELTPAGFAAVPQARGIVDAPPPPPPKQKRSRPRPVDPAPAPDEPPPHDQMPPGPPPDDDDAGVDLGLPPGCPVVPLGRLGSNFYYLDALNQLRALTHQQHGRTGLLDLVSPQTWWLYQNYPRMNQDGETTGWRPELVGEALMAACSRKGIWTPTGTVREAGAWLDDAGRPVLHVGNAVLQDGEYKPPGSHGRYVYPARPNLARPHAKPQPYGADGAGYQLLRLFGSWHWARGELDARLLLGWVVAALLGGALKWRPSAWLTGDKATGKSTLQEVLQHVLDTWLLQAANATAAALYQTNGLSSLAIALDELEPDADNRHVQAIIALARLAGSGAKLRRGGQDGQSAEFEIRSCFLFSSILIPPLTSQDRSRLAVLELLKLESTTPPKIVPAELRELGTKLLRQAIDGWPRLEALLFQYRSALADKGHAGRGADVFGTLLACAEMVLSDQALDSDTCELHVEKLHAAKMAAQSGDAADHENCTNRLLTSTLQVYRSGAMRTAGQWAHQSVHGEGDGRLEAQVALNTYGLRVLTQKVITPDLKEVDVHWLAVANYHSKLAELFEGTHWAAGTAGQQGVWVQALRRVPGARVPAQPIRVGAGPPLRVTLLPLATIMPEEGNLSGLWAVEEDQP